MFLNGPKKSPCSASLICATHLQRGLVSRHANEKGTIIYMQIVVKKDLWAVQMFSIHVVTDALVCCMDIGIARQNEVA